MKKYIKGFFKEIVPVIAGILIALWINNWNENRKDRAYVDSMYSSIKKELRESNKEIDYKMKLQKRLFDTITKYIHDDKVSLFDVMYKGGGGQLLSIKINAWKTLSNSKIDLMDYEKVSLLSNIEEGKEILKMKSEYFMNFLYSNIYKKEPNQKETARMLVSELISTERDLKNYIEKIINE